MLLTENRLVGMSILAIWLSLVNSPGCLADDNGGIQQTLELLDSEKSTVVANAVWRLGSSFGKDIGDTAIRALVQRLSDERAVGAHQFMGPPPPTVGNYASDALVQIGTEQVVTPVCEFLVTSDSEQGRVLAIETLERLGHVASASVSVLASCAQDESERIRFRAIGAIASVSPDDAETVRVLRHALHDKAGNVKYTAVYHLGNLGPKAAGAVPELIPLLDSSDLRSHWDTPHMGGWISLRPDVAKALGQIGPASKAALPKLERMLRDEDWRLRNAAAFAHCRISGERTPGLNVLLEELEHGRDWSARKAAEFLGQLKCQRFFQPAVQGLKKALKHPDNLVRCTAAESIAAIAPADWIDFLRPLAKDSNGIVQDCVMNVFCEHATEHPELLDIFVECLTCETGCECKGMTGRCIAADALGKMGIHAKSAIPLLQKCAETDDDQGVREYAKEALQKITAAVSRECGPEGVNVLSQPEK